MADPEARANPWSSLVNAGPRCLSVLSACVPSCQAGGCRHANPARVLLCLGPVCETCSLRAAANLCVVMATSISVCVVPACLPAYLMDVTWLQGKAAGQVCQLTGGPDLTRAQLR